MTKIILTSGAELNITESSTAVVLNLYRAIHDEIEKQDLSLKGLENVVNSDSDLDLKLILLANIDKLLKLATGSFVSENVLSVIFECGKRCTYKKMKVTVDLFDDAEHRQDFFEVVYLIARENLIPFFPKALLKLFEQKKGEKKSEA